MTTTGVLKEYKHLGRTVSLPYCGPLEDADFHQEKQYWKWQWDLLKQGGLASYSYRVAHIRWHLSSGGVAVKGVFKEGSEARQFFARYSRPKVFLAVNQETFQAMHQDVSRNEGPPQAVELVTESNGLVNMRLYHYAQLDGTSPKGTQVHTWWPGHVFFDYAKFLQDNRNWTMDCSVKREAELERTKKGGRRGGF